MTSTDGPALRRTLRSRHLTMIALGGTVGAGLFVGSGSVIAATGPAVVLSYAAGGAVVVLVMRMLAEMAVAHPSTGSFVDHARQAVGPGAGYAVGWLYWWGWVVALAFEAVAGAAVLHAWLPAVPLGGWALGLLALVVAGNLVSVRAFGESESWLAAVKVAAIVAFLAVGVLAVLGLLPGRSGGLPGLAGAELVPAGWLAVLSALVAVLFTYGGTEIVAIAAGEVADPGRALVRATRQVVGRIVLFYVGSIALIVALVPWSELPPDRSPFAVVLERLGVPGAATAIDVLVLVALLSAMNSAVYVCSRTLFALADAGDARPALAAVDARGVPRRAVLTCAGVAAAATALAFVSPDGVFLVLLGTAGAISLPVYALVAVAQIRLRRRREAAGEPDPAVRMWLFPHLSRAVVVLVAAIAASMAVLPDFQLQLVLTGAVLAGLWGAHRLRGRRAAAPTAG